MNVHFDNILLIYRNSLLENWRAKHYDRAITIEFGEKTGNVINGWYFAHF
jgi:hypothetical protein